MWNVFHPYLTSAIFSPLDFCLWGYLKSKSYHPQRAAGQHRQGGCADWSCHDDEGNAGHEGKGSEVHCCRGRTFCEVEQWPFVSLSSHREKFDDILKKCRPKWTYMYVAHMLQITSSLKYIVQRYRVFFLTGPTLKVLSVRLHSKSHQKSSESVRI